MESHLKPIIQLFMKQNLFIIRFGNLLLETGTLLLVGRRVNKTVSLLPQVAKKLKNYFDKLPMEPIDRLFFDSEFGFVHTLPLQKYCLHVFFANNSISDPTLFLHAIFNMVAELKY